MTYPIILWDWNGTLLDDVSICVDAMNSLLAKRNLQAIDESIYRSLFGFPVKAYYNKLGFTFELETFEAVSVEFIEAYNLRVASGACMHKRAIAILDALRKQGRRQVIMSAMERQMLQNQLSLYSVSHLFDDVCGVSDIYANGKTQMALEYFKTNTINPEEVVFIGDTLHDSEVAAALGCSLILVSHGHHSFERLSATGSVVVQNLEELYEHLI